MQMKGNPLLYGEIIGKCKNTLNLRKKSPKPAGQFQTWYKSYSSKRNSNCTNKGTGPFQREYNHNNAKIGWII
jgi:hypothetical protein